MKGLMWAVLSAYARTLPRGPEHDQARRLANVDRPDRYGPCLVEATARGFLHQAALTPKGHAAVKAFLTDYQAAFHHFDDSREKT